MEGIKLYTKILDKYLSINNISGTNSNVSHIYIDYLRYFPDNELKKIINRIPYLLYGMEKNTKSYKMAKNQAFLKYFVAVKFHSIVKKILLLILIILNGFNIKCNLLNEWYYRMFYK